MTAASKITQKQIASFAGVSQNAVSVAFGGRGHISEKTRRRILNVAQKHGYRVNTAARAMRQGRHNAIGMIKSATKPEAGGASNATLYSIESTAEELQQRLVVGRLTDDEFVDVETLPQVLTEWAIDGVLVFYNAQAPHTIEDRLKRFRIPAVWVDALREHDSVRCDYEAIGRQATEHLLELGHQRIAFLGRTEGLRYGRSQQVAGFQAAMRQAGRSGKIDSAAALDLQAAVELLRDVDRPTGIVVSEGFMTIIMAAVSLGIRIPRDLSLIVIRDYFYTGSGVAGGIPEQYFPTSILLPTFPLGAQAVRMLVEKIEQPSRLLATQALPGILHEGKTCASYQV